MIVGLDLAPRKCGWCAGDGSTTPIAGGFRLLSALNDGAGLLEETRRGIVTVFDRFRPTVVMYESPILPNNRRRGAQGPVVGTVDQRRAQFAQGYFVEWLCLQRGIHCEEATVAEVKAALTGNPRADKDKDMVPAALKLGIVLPELKVDGREDAADAVGAWLVGVRCHAKQFLPAWDRRVHSPRGGLI